MGRRARMIVGGALAGLGGGLIQRSKDRVKEETRKREELLILLRDKTRRDFDTNQSELAAKLAVKRDTAQQKHRSGLIVSSEVAEDMSVKLITAGGKVSDAGFNARPNAASSGRSAGDSRLISDAFDANTKKTLTEDVIDMEGIVRYLIKANAPHLAELYKSSSGSVSIDKNGSDWLQSREDAEALGAERDPIGPNIFRDVPAAYEGLGEEEWLQKKTMELYLETMGIAKPTAGTSSSESIGDVMAQGRSMAEDAGITESSKQYKTIEEVGEALRNGVISQQEAKRIWREQFGVE